MVALAIAAGYITGESERRVNQNLRDELKSEARALALRHATVLSGEDALEQFPIGTEAGLRPHELIALVIPHERAIVPTEFESAEWRKKLELAPEVLLAVQGGVAHYVRTLDRQTGPTHVVAVRVSPDGTRVLWLARPYWRLFTTSEFVLKTLIASIVLIVLTSLVSVMMLRRLWTRPMQQIRAVARSLSEGDVSSRVEVSGSDELAELGVSLNELRGRWAADMRTIDRQRRSLESLLNQLHEGVVVVRPDGRIALINPAAVQLLNLDPIGRDGGVQYIGKIVERVIPHYDLQQLLRITAPREPGIDLTKSSEFQLHGGSSVQEARLQLETAGGLMHILARASDLTLADPQPGDRPAAAGRLLVLTDITELSKTIQIKTDFVANASHELRTPLSTIRAAIETLASMNLMEESEDAAHFINVVDRHSARLSAMVSDLLDLARLESPDARFQRNDIAPRQILLELQERFADVFRAKGLLWEMRCEDAQRPLISISPQLLRLVLDNLVDNATKFTERGGRISVSCISEPGQVTFAVADEGCGIPEQEQERVFERFYQVERARSGPERGTGLGLSIVRHAISRMRGEVALESKVGIGTRITVRIPQERSSAAA